MMSERRTKEKKIMANYQFLLKLNQEGSTPKISFVKPESSIQITKEKQNIPVQKNTTKSPSEANIAFIKKDIFKSLSLTIFILVLEIVLYFVLR